ncbi:MAG: type III pantothenate kinase [Burkholderiaceae bacterium]|nr:type III pantothenate kinase [Burkholderiaceae bacterium]
MSFLALDVGNTRLKWALYAAPRPGAGLLAQGAIFLDNIERLPETDWATLPAPSSVLGCNVAGEAVRRRVEEQLELWDIDPHWVVPSAHGGGVTNGYDHPGRLGADRWTALIGARHRVQVRGSAHPALVVMVGTAVTVDALDATGRFIGGLIMPGFGLMLRALELGTAGLKAPSGNAVDFPTNTSDALMSGGAHAIAGAIERVHRKLARCTGQAPLLLISGGAAVKLAPIIELAYEPVDMLIFEGLLVLQAQKLAL